MIFVVEVVSEWLFYWQERRRNSKPNDFVGVRDFIEIMSGEVDALKILYYKDRKQDCESVIIKILE